jgi:hypothetical protein
LAEGQNEPTTVQISLETRANKHYRLLDKVSHCSTPGNLLEKILYQSSWWRSYLAHEILSCKIVLNPVRAVNYPQGIWNRRRINPDLLDKETQNILGDHNDASNPVRSTLKVSANGSGICPS